MTEAPGAGKGVEQSNRRGAKATADFEFTGEFRTVMKILYSI
jgi:hypothetical protein